MAKRKTAKKTAPSRLYLKVDVYCWVTRERDPEDEWSRDCTASSHDVLSLHVTQPRVGREDIVEVPVEFEPQPETEYYAVCAQYSTGDSFGNDEGRGFEVVGVYSDKELAESIVLKLEGHDTVRRYLEGHLGRPTAKSKGYDAHSVELKLESGRTYYYAPPWVGYFESLDWVRLYPLKLT